MPRRKSPTSQKSTRERLAEKKARLEEAQRADGSKFVHTMELAQVEKSLDDLIEERGYDVRQRRLKMTIEKLSIADLYLSGYSTAEIAEQLNYSEEFVTAQLKHVQTGINQRMLSLSENLVLVQLSRTEQLMKRYYPLALSMDDKAFDRVMKLMALQLELQKSVIIPDTDDAMNKLERFQRTITSNSRLYEVAQDNIDAGWLEQSNMTVDDLFKQVQNLGELSQMKDDIAELEALANKEINADASTDGLSPTNSDSGPELRPEEQRPAQSQDNGDDSGALVDRAVEDQPPLV